MNNTGKNQHRDDKELVKKRKTKLLTDLKEVRERMREISLCLRRPGCFNAKEYEEFIDEHNTLTIKAGHIERALYREFSMSERQIDNGLKMIEL
ncbi:hypothetical protein EZS27_031548 [termite gut metagenome]|uniref:Uncharacterized protein n=1 Tax=termite gut metagenome TaxID=433724 RepID=A0A5J4QCJ9_9ZZZZ